MKTPSASSQLFVIIKILMIKRERTWKIICFQVQNVCEFIFEDRGKLFSSLGAKSRQINLRGNGGSWSTMEKMWICVFFCIWVFVIKKMIKSAKDYEIRFSVSQTISHGQWGKVQDKSTKPARPTQDIDIIHASPSCLVKRGHIALITGDNFGGVFVTAL